MLSPHGPLPFHATVHPQARPAVRLTWDSREADAETAFVALPGEKEHGNRYIEAALERGAPFVLTDLPGAASRLPRTVEVGDSLAALTAWAQQERAKNPLVVGITGSVGKTTTKSYVAAALNAHYMPVYNTLPAIACFLIEFGASGRPLVIEMGIDRVGEMDQLNALVRPDVGVVTSIGAAHLERLGSLEVIAHEKGQILHAPRALVGSQARAWFPEQDIYGFSTLDLPVQHSGQDLRVTEQGADFTYSGHAVHLVGAAQVQAEAAVLGLYLAESHGLPLADAIGRVEQVQVPSGRYQIHSGRYTVIDDAYNASPLAVQAALSALQNFRGRRIAVLGTMLELGDSAPELHAEVGRSACESADLCFGVGPYAGVLGKQAYRTVPELAAALKAEVRDGDVILVKASRGISMTPEERAQEGVGLDTLVRELLEWRDQPPADQTLA
ncbi:UDP-N-acetylmuramoyl-tripeptide--D-alanyl-D-alanine ligase [Deinococcus piscis]|uniref:UDP-N-acetylmuramoyl-tripeptide--D-alanyl-D-alanine ligase n=1 Tax=Deinococcus piscis TaxID=394230 RepID=A0ABQ3K3T5_9DEIO|nr:UDP-N-acetylmuramoyl-tripeptide--D-alanyl-D-alanine ligase [Deinococcus piscis]GHF99538.1 UDP-N-acetylmuramoyl-tripeptide--D-alanyl-D-alanine ligase [Deinococcus piscis]